MIRLDHICMASLNVYESTFRLSQETGLGNYDGGFFPTYGIGHRVIPVAPDVYIEVESVIDQRAVARGEAISVFMNEQSKVGDCFLGWCLRSDTAEELEAFAAHHGTVVDPNTTGTNGRQLMNGSRGFSLQAPSAPTAWPMGKPNLYYKPSGEHAASLPVVEGSGLPGLGVEWIEIGEDEDSFKRWMGDLYSICDFPFEIRYNAKTPGFYAMGVKTESKIVEIRRPAVQIPA